MCICTSVAQAFSFPGMASPSVSMVRGSWKRMKTSQLVRLLQVSKDRKDAQFLSRKTSRHQRLLHRRFFTVEALPSPQSFPAYARKDFFHFESIYESKRSRARVGRLHTPHGIVDTPSFVAVGTNGVLKGVTNQQAKEAGLQLMFANTYHLLLQPGLETIQAAGGLHSFMHRDQPLITDSGGFQAFSLAYGSIQDERSMKSSNKAFSSQSVDERRNASGVVSINERGITFRSYRDGRRIQLTPELSVQAQKILHADIIVPLDELPPYHITSMELATSLARTHRWQARSLSEHLKHVHEQAMYGIIHGGNVKQLREQSVAYLTALPFDGFAIGGSIGKDREEMLDILKYVLPLLPREKPNHVLGIGDVPSIEASVTLGVDTYDSCYPLRSARHGTVLSLTRGSFSLRRGSCATMFEPIDEASHCTCPACAQNHSIAYLHHLFKAKEALGPMLVSMHNLHYMSRKMGQIRTQILQGEL